MPEAFRIYAVVAVVLFALGFRAFVAYAHLLRKVMAINVMSSGVFLLLIGIARRDAEEHPDPVPHAMVLTGIVVAVAISVLALTLARRIHSETGGTTLFDAEEEPQDEEVPDE